MTISGPAANCRKSAPRRRTKNVESYRLGRKVSKMSGKTTKNARRRLVLASTSRYRKALLERLRVPFDVAAPDVDERQLPGETPAATACRLAEAKARAVAAPVPRCARHRLGPGRRLRTAWRSASRAITPSRGRATARAVGADDRVSHGGGAARRGDRRVPAARSSTCAARFGTLVAGGDRALPASRNSPTTARAR